jgi:bifunctional lysine-specific demethylase and histidyl-hydroxylase NO66
VVDAPALRHLVGDVAGFLNATWGKAPLHVVAGDAQAGLADLISLEDVDHLVAATGLRAPGFRLVRQGKTLPQSRVTRNVRIGSRPVTDLVDVAAVHREVAASATLVLQGLHRSFAPVAAFCRDLERTLTHPVQANAYLTPPVAQGLNLHEDPHDVFAVQSYGTKRWVVHPPGDGRVWDLELRPGDVLYLPAGTRHAAQTVGEPSLHLTLGVRTVTWRQLVTKVIEDAVEEAFADDPGQDGPLPAGWAQQPGDLHDGLTTTVQRVAAHLAAGPDVTSVTERAAQRFWTSRVPDRAGGLRDILELDRVQDRTPLQRRADVLARIDGDDGESGPVDGDHVDLVLVDRRLRVPAALTPALQWILGVVRFRPRDLDDLMDEASRVVLCRRLIREGLLLVDRDPAGD